MSRKDTLKAMLARRDHELPHGNSVDGTVENLHVEAAVPVKTLQHIRSGAVGAMGRSLGQIASAADQAKALIAAGAAVIEISAEKLEASFISDRLEDDGPEFERLMLAITESGQKSPILARPHPSDQDRYQIAFGHRRVRVLAKLGRPVKAVVQNLSDEELVVIQGQENSARADLSYIERGLFAVALEARGFDRQVIMSALSMEKTQLSRLLSLAHSIPRSLAQLIGPAPKAGRPRWVALAERLAQLKNRDALDRLLDCQEFKSADTDSRFVKVFNAVAPQRERREAPEVWKTDNGTKIASIGRSNGKVSMVFDEKNAPEFADFIASQLGALHEAYLKSRDMKSD
jgi:ParB family chromosome partitioning protein